MNFSFLTPSNIHVKKKTPTNILFVCIWF